MKTDIHIEPETDEEFEVVEMLATAREIGLQEAEMEPEDLAALFNFFAVGIMRDEAVEPDPAFDCPVCGDPVMSHDSSEIGGDPIMDPCGCQVPWSQIPQDYQAEHFGLDES